MAESCQAYKCTYGSRLEHLFSFIIFFFPGNLAFGCSGPGGVISEKDYIFDRN